MSDRLTKEELLTLRQLEKWCYDTLNYAVISPRILTVLLDRYEDVTKPTGVNEIKSIEKQRKKTTAEIEAEDRAFWRAMSNRGIF
ncbi:hypothetical protein G3M81_12435 [Bacillus paralicheniformis]|uniref:hypothetical protein n=1 Tax=Bacillus paralicheniformis TaxID=1648923 RepID=UPI0013EF2177|nr:hypothetical protein [Bacillus paralicheniformis]QII49497.1 hypothetical protein G3M81_12435 [Bacillus paralicheniformis]